MATDVRLAESEQTVGDGEGDVTMKDGTDKISKVSSEAQSPESVDPPVYNFASGEHVTIWNNIEQRKIAGNAAPLGKNLAKYLAKHPECEVYKRQDVERVLSRGNSKGRTEGSGLGVHVPIWNREERRKIAGNAAPLAKNLNVYLARHPDCEVYDGQDKEEGMLPSGRRNQSAAQRMPMPTAVPFIDPWLARSPQYSSFEVDVDELDFHAVDNAQDFGFLVDDDVVLDDFDFDTGMDFSPSGFLALGSMASQNCDFSVQVE